VANFVGKMGMASGIIPDSYIFTMGYHHFGTFSHELEKVNNSQTFSSTDYSHYTVLAARVYLST